ncbi:MAG: transaldolase [Acidobacteria bacterium]|nr:MAG: transaldolase [Acidobacteriota bacterium]
MKNNPLVELQKYGQSFWLDNITRQLITSGGLTRLVEEDGLRGVTSNPTIFEKAITGSSSYDEEFAQAVSAGKDVTAIYEELTTEDIRRGCDVLRPVYDASDGADGFVSLEVGPHLAHDTAGTIAEAKRLHARVDRPNLMIKVPATPAGIPAIAQLLADGLNINITLMFALENYEQVADAYLRGLEQRVAARQPIEQIASVASLFVSRVDTKVDKLLAAKLEATSDAAAREHLQSLKGCVAIANAKMMYQKYKELFGANERWQQLRSSGARAQRLLWASTSTKNPDYPDTYYVEALIGPDTVDTLPPQTIDAFREHGRVAPRLEAGLDEARETLSRLAEVGISLRQVTQELQDEGVASFAKSFDELISALAKKTGRHARA